MLKNINELENSLKESVRIFNEIFSYLLANPIVKNKFKEELHLQVIYLLHRKIISLIQSILILNTHFKYSEARMLIRNMFETTLLMLYFKKFNHEAKRWLDWQDELLKKIEPIPKDLGGFRQYLIANKYLETEKILNRENFKALRYFQPWYIRKIVFEDHTLIKSSDFSRFNEIINIFAHPTISSLNLNDSYNEEMYNDVLKTSLFIYVQSGDVFVESISHRINPQLVSKYADFTSKELNYYFLDKNN